MHLFLRYLTGLFDNGLETDSEETEKKEILKEDGSVEDDLLYYSDAENVVSKDGDHLRNGELKDNPRKHISALVKMKVLQKVLQAMP